ncbi:hypothetical protein K466DRAFT_54062 [Polyporus arcularius HHB13444]|uniref:Uncharacterized protein n=1 Tax=Polyporus arcularius HHB13444 TaxID=1314778 RepID=A0A5C3PHU9_9APHY|nr:hypothetical protein K466DRAFT_54062 [Polyporus arcularius HHB13444]
MLCQVVSLRRGFTRSARTLGGCRTMVLPLPIAKELLGFTIPYRCPTNVWSTTPTRAFFPAPSWLCTFSCSEPVDGLDVNDERTRASWH